MEKEHDQISGAMLQKTSEAVIAPIPQDKSDLLML